MASFGGSVKLTGESEYRKVLKEITSNLKLVSSELKLTDTQFKNGDTSINKAKSSYSSLNNTIEDQKDKVSKLRKALKEMEETYGNDNEKVKQFKIQLNDAESKLSDMEKQSNKSNKELKQIKEGFDDAGEGALTFSDLVKANLLSEAIKGGFCKLVDLTKQLGSSLLDLGKQALNGYADYEQLVGGVETLFKDSQNVVVSYANDAYKTSGLSANSYMETITGFSASLLQSLGGDTAKAAEVGNMAVVDMSDNANKMGTSMESIQNSYQGFAKQNYTMLDNLKLGYGGTKTEMERLLSDATKISGIKYDISNLNDVYSAIHVVQTELGITGTTAKEASTTISGSARSMKTSWSNLVTGMADDNANFEQLVGNFVEILVTFIQNVAPRIGTIIKGICMMIPQLIQETIPVLLPVIGEVFNNILLDMNNYLPIFIEQLQTGITTLLQIITDSIPLVMPVITQIIMTLITTLTQNLPTILDMGIKMILSLVNGLVQTLPNLIPVAIEAVLNLVDTLLDNIDFLVDSGINLIIALAEGLINALPQLIGKIPIIIEKLLTAIANNEPKLLEAGIKLVIQLSYGLIKSIPQLITAIPKIMKSILDYFPRYWSNMSEVGLNLVKGIWNGINDATGWILGKIKGFGNSVLNGIKSFFGIHSPSRLFKDEIGTNLALGIGEGFSDTMNDVSNEMSNAIPTSFDTEITSNYSNQKANLMNSDYLINSFKVALKEMKIEMNERSMGSFVEEKMNKIVYS